MGRDLKKGGMPHPGYKIDRLHCYEIKPILKYISKNIRSWIRKVVYRITLSMEKQEIIRLKWVKME